MNDEKKYSTPSVTVYGKVEDLTRQGDLPNADVPSGDDSTAYSPN